MKPIWDIYFLRLRLNVVTLLTKSLVCSPVIKLLLLHVAIQVSSSSALWVGGGVWSATFFGSFLISCYSYKRALPLPLFCVCVPRSYGLVLWPGPCTFNNAERRAQAHLYHGLSAVVHCACIKTKSCSSILLHLNRMYLFFVRTRSLNHAARLCGSLDVETTPVFVHNSPRGCIIRNLWCVRCFSLSVCLLHSYSCEFIFYFLSISLTYLAV